MRTTERPTPPSHDPHLANFTDHARKRLIKRSIDPAAVSAAIDYGRIVHVRGADIYVIGRREISLLRRHGLDLSKYEGVQVVCSRDGAIVTVYRNRNFRSLRPRRGRRSCDCVRCNRRKR